MRVGEYVVDHRGVLIGLNEHLQVLCMNALAGAVSNQIQLDAVLKKMARLLESNLAQKLYGRVETLHGHRGLQKEPPLRPCLSDLRLCDCTLLNSVRSQEHVHLPSSPGCLRVNSGNTPTSPQVSAEGAPGGRRTSLVGARLYRCFFPRFPEVNERGVQEEQRRI